MTPQEIQSYSVKMAEMMGWPTHRSSLQLTGKRKITSIPINYNFHSEWSAQIEVWQKVYDKNLDLVVEGKIDHVKEFMQLRESFMHRIDRGTPLDSFAILCKAIDLIETKK